jgi:glycogen(starch) synthase
MPNPHMVGPVPPPYGGVAIHIVRLREALAAKGLTTTMVPTNGSTPKMVARVLARTARAAFVHFHTDEGNYKSTILFSHWWRLLNIPYILTTHSFRSLPAFEKPSIRRALCSAYTNAAARIAISESTGDALRAVLGLDANTIDVVSSTLPVSRAELNASLPPLPSAWQGAPIRILANAGRLVRFNGEDLYGLDLVVEAMRLVDNPRVHALLAVADVVDASLLEPLETAAASDRRIHLVQSSWPLAQVARHAHIVIRPTRTEGGPSLTLAEAAQLGAFTIGSDAVERPPRTRLFRSGDAASLAAVLQKTIADVDAGIRAPLAQDSTDVINQLMAAYTRAGLVNTENTPAEV